MELNEGERLGEEVEEAGAHQQQQQKGESFSGRKKKNQVRVRALLFAQARELAGVSEASLDIDDGWTTAQCLEEILFRFPALKSLASCLTVALNDSYVDKNAPLLVKDGDKLALIPPISGG